MYLWKKLTGQVSMNYLDKLPLDVILEILNIIDLDSQLKFISTCKKYRLLFDNSDINIVSKFYKGLICVSGNLSRILCIVDNIEKNICSKIKKLNIVINDMNICFDFPNLTQLKLISKNYVFLCNWQLPLLEILDISECHKCVLDECQFLMLRELHKSSLHRLPLRFCGMHATVQIMIYSESLFSRTYTIQEYDTIVCKEIITAQNMRVFDWKRDIFHNHYYLCSTCESNCIITKTNKFCSICGITSLLSNKEIAILNSPPQCILCLTNLNIFMNQYGCGMGICSICRREMVMSKLQMIAAKKIKGYNTYPAIYINK